MTGQAARLRIAEDTAFFGLEDHGILFGGSRQELQLLDAASAYVWCSIEDGVPPDRIAAGYAEECGVSRADADRLVGGLMHRWYGFGYVEGDGLPPPPEPIDFTTALARLLINPALRRSYAAAPEATADRLGLRESDRPAFLGLDAAQLDRQAHAIERQRRRIRETRPIHEHDAIRSLAPRLLTGRRNKAAVERCWRLCGTVVRLCFDTNQQAEVVRLGLLHLEAAADAEPDLTLDVVEAKQGHAVLRDGALIGHCDRLDQLARAVIMLVRDLVLERTDYFLLLHAAVLSSGDACVLLPAAPGSGKTTLAAALACSGFEYFTDEIAILEEQDLRVRPFPLPAVIKDGSVAALRRYYPALPGMPVSRRDNDQPVRYLPPPVESVPADTVTDVQVRWIVFPTYRAIGETSLKPVSIGAALSRLMGECKVVTADLDRERVAAFVRWLRQVECYEMKVSSLPDAVALLRGLCHRERIALKPSHAGSSM